MVFRHRANCRYQSQGAHLKESPEVATEIATGVAETPEKASQVNLPEDATFVI